MNILRISGGAVEGGRWRGTVHSGEVPKGKNSEGSLGREERTGRPSQGRSRAVWTIKHRENCWKEGPTFG